MKERKLRWQTGTVKKMNTVDYLKGFSDGSNKKFEELFEPVEKEIAKLREALEGIKKQCVETTTISPLNDLRVVRNIAKEALKS